MLRVRYNINIVLPPRDAANIEEGKNGVRMRVPAPYGKARGGRKPTEKEGRTVNTEWKKSG